LLISPTRFDPNAQHRGEIRERLEEFAAEKGSLGRLMAGCSRAAGFALLQSNSNGVSALRYEGNWSAAIGGAVNIATSVVLFGLLFAGSLLWARQRLRLQQQGATSWTL
jgi:hypothetical protein